MAHVYITSNHASLGLSQGRLTVEQPDMHSTREIPLVDVDSINVYGNPQISTQLVKECLKRGTPIGYYSEDGRYTGRIMPFGCVDPSRQKQQVLLADDDAFRLGVSRAIVSAKIENSLALLSSLPSVCEFTEADMKGLLHSKRSLGVAEDVDMVMGFEGNAAKSYFSCLSQLVADERFSFTGRSTRPPKDAFNSMLSYGYSLLYREIVGAIERHGLHPYFGFMHKIRRGHAALASDLIEELRAPFVDTVVLAVIDSGVLSPQDFHTAEDGGVYMERNAMKCLTNRLSAEMEARRPYFSAYGDGHSYAFQTMLDKKIDSLIHAIEARDFEGYMPVLWSPEC